MVKIPVNKPTMPVLEDVIELQKEMWDKEIITDRGPLHERLRKGLEGYFGTEYISMFSSGHSALENAIAVFDFPKGSEIITTPYTFISTIHAIVRNGLVPVFCDIENRNYTLDSNKIEQLITDKTVAILPVHLFGASCDIEVIQNVADKYGLRVIYDAAHAFGVSYKGKSICQYGDASMVSFHASKIYNTVEGGCVVSKDIETREKLDSIGRFGYKGVKDILYIGENAKLSELHAAVGLCNLKNIDKEIAERKRVADHYRSRLENIEGIQLPSAQNNVVSNYSYMPVLFTGNYSRNDIAVRLEESGIDSRKSFYPLTYNSTCYEDCEFVKNVNVPVAEFVATHILTLPMYGALSNEDIDLICDKIIGDKCGRKRTSKRVI